MSYDLEVWSIHPVKAHEHRDRTAGWQLVINPSEFATAEDAPPEVIAALPEAKYLTQLNLEGVTSAKAEAFAISAAIDVARECEGVVVDPQIMMLWTPRGMQKLRVEASKERLSMIKLLWCFIDGPLCTLNGQERMLDLLAAELPEALPKRYGSTEPLPHIYAKTGREHLLNFLAEEKFAVFWDPHPPVTDVHLSVHSPAGASRRGFRSRCFEIGIEEPLPAWQSTRLRRLWEDLSCMIQPFYGEVRTLRGFVRGKRTVHVDSETDLGPISGPWWRGIPRKLGHAAVLGETYQPLWPAFVSGAAMRDGLAFVSTADWTSPQTIAELIGDPPPRIAAPSIPRQMGAPSLTPESYAEQWPFEPPFTP